MSMFLIGQTRFTIDLLYSINRASDQSYILNKVDSAGFFVCLFACLFFILPEYRKFRISNLSETRLLEE